MSWLSWFSLAMAVVALTLSIRAYRRSKRQAELAEEQRARIEAALAEWMENHGDL